MVAARKETVHGLTDRIKFRVPRWFLVSGFRFLEKIFFFSGVGLRARRWIIGPYDSVGTSLQRDGDYPSHERQRVVHRLPARRGAMTGVREARHFHGLRVTFITCAHPERPELEGAPSA